METSSKERGVSSAVEARSYLDDLVSEGRQPLKSALPRLAGRLGMTPRRVKALWSGEARRIDHDEIKKLQAAAIKQQVLDAQRHAARLEALAIRLEGNDAEFHAADIAAARAQAQRLWNLAGGKE